MGGQDTTQRNMDIYDYYNAGMSYGAIAEKYGISSTRVFQICERIRQREEFAQGNEMYSVIADAAAVLNKSESQSVKLYNILMRHGIDNVDKLSSLCLKELLSWYNAGRECAALCAMAQKKIVERRL